MSRLIPPLLLVLAACPAVSVVKHPMRQALDDRGAPPLGSFGRRATAEDVAGLIALSDPRVVPPSLTPANVVAWQAKLDAAWGDPASPTSKAAADEVVFGAAPPRDEIDALLTLNRDPLRYFSELLGSSAAGAAALDSMTKLRALAYEIVLEADLLALASAADAAPFEEFLQRYPDTPFTAAVQRELAQRRH